MADALAKYRAALKRYRKENPNVPYATAQKRVSGMMKSGAISGTKKRKRRVGTTAAASHKSASRFSHKRASTARVGKTHIRPVAKPKTRMQTAGALIRKIDRLELKRKQEKFREMKDLIQLEINACHDKLDRIKGSYKRKSA